jgi:hypothetical protein
MVLFHKRFIAAGRRTFGQVAGVNAPAGWALQADTPALTG